jgi:hypothetical protein
MLRSVTRAVVIVAVATTGIFASAGAASAAAPLARLTASTSGATATSPTSQITGSGKLRKFAPNHVTAAPATGTCSSTNYSFLVKNVTHGTGAGSGVITLKGDAKAKLNFTIT